MNHVLVLLLVLVLVLAAVWQVVAFGFHFEDFHIVPLSIVLCLHTRRFVVLHWGVLWLNSSSRSTGYRRGDCCAGGVSLFVIVTIHGVIGIGCACFGWA